MATNQTEHFQLNQWVPEDAVLREDFNADNQKLDRALNTLQTSLKGKAAQTALDGVRYQVAAKADQSAVDALRNQVNTKASQSALNTLNKQVQQKFGSDFSFVVSGDFVGDGQMVRTLELGFRPSFLMVQRKNVGSGGETVFIQGDGEHQFVGCTSSGTYTASGVFQFTDTGVTIDNNRVTFAYFNSQDKAYHYVAFR